MVKKLNRGNIFYSKNLKLCSQSIERDVVFHVEIRADWDKSRPPQAVVSKGCDLLGEVGRSVCLTNLLIPCPLFFLMPLKGAHFGIGWCKKVLVLWCELLILLSPVLMHFYNMCLCSFCFFLIQHFHLWRDFLSEIR